MTPEAFARRVARCWSGKTASVHRADNPAHGQCSVTALLAQEILGGTLERTRVGNAWHYYNRIDDDRWDFTASQFASAVHYEDLPCGPSDALADTTPAQLAALRRAYGVA